MTDAVRLLQQVAVLAREISGRLDAASVLQHVADAVVRLRGDAVARIRLVDEAGVDVRTASSPDEASAARLPHEAQLVHIVRHTREPLLDEVRGYYAVPIAAGDRVLAVLEVGVPPHRPLAEEERSAVLALTGHAAVAILNAELYGETEARRRTADALAEVGRLLPQALDPDAMAQTIADSVQALLRAHSAAVYAVDADSGHLVTIATAGDIVPHFPRKTPIEDGTGSVGLALRTRRPVVSANVLTDPRITLTPETRARVERSRSRAVLTIPLVAKDKTIGALVAGDREGRVFCAADLRVAQAFADQAAVALENARLFAVAERRRREAEIIADLVRAINASLDLDTLLRRVLGGARELCAADGGFVALREPDTGRVTVRESSEPPERWRGLGVDPGRGVGGRVLETGQPFRTDDYLADSRITADFREAAKTEGAIAVAAVPIAIDDRIEGLLYLFNRSRRPFTDRHEAILLRLADHAGLAIKKSVLLDAEAAARGQAETKRTEAEAVQERLAFLADASTVLALSLDYDETLRSLAALAVPRLADWCTVDMLEEDGSIRRLAVAHVDPARTRLARQMQQRYPIDPRAPSGIAKVLRTGESEFHADITDVVLVEHASDVAHLAHLRGLGLRSAMLVPLRGRGRVLGAITFVTAESGRVYEPRDLALAEDLARRAALALDNARLYREFQEADRHKDEFLAMLAHELRAPLAPILSAMRIIGRAERQAPIQQAREVVERQVRHQARLLDDLLDVSRISRGKIKLVKTRVGLDVIARDALEGTRALIEERRHTVTLAFPDEPLVLEADATRLTQVVANLVNNAAKYTDPGGRITVRAAREGDDAVLRIADTGVGIPREALPRVFDLFAQVEAHRERSRGGLGIGLTLVRRLVELHGGSVIAHSEGPGHGSEFEIRVPLASVETAPTPAPAPADAPAARHILLVEDDPDAREMMRLVLELDGHRVDVAGDGESALEVTRAGRPEIALVDIGLPGIDGYDVARALRAAPGPPIVLIALTGHGRPEDVQRAREAGFDFHLVKPVAIEDLHRVLAGT